jgi:hypothetical protein
MINPTQSDIKRQTGYGLIVLLFHRRYFAEMYSRNRATKLFLVACSPSEVPLILATSQMCGPCTGYTPGPRSVRAGRFSPPSFQDTTHPASAPEPKPHAYPGVYPGRLQDRLTGSQKGQLRSIYGHLLPQARRSMMRISTMRASRASVRRIHTSR